MELLVHNVDVWAASIPDKPAGLASVLATVRDAKSDLQLINLRGFSASVIGAQFVAYLALDSLEAVNKAIETLKGW